MSTASSAPSPQVAPAPAPVQADQDSKFHLDRIEQYVATSRGVAWTIILAVPTLGILASVYLALPLFAVLMCGGMLFGVAFTCVKAIAQFTGRTLRVLVAERLVIVFVLGALLFLTSGHIWMTVMASCTLWLMADKLVGRFALYDLWKRVKRQKKQV